VPASESFACKHHSGSVWVCRLYRRKRDAVDIAAWLRELGLERYEPAFRDNEIDAEVLPRLTAEDLTALGVTAVGHRRKLLDAVAALRKGNVTLAPELADTTASTLPTAILAAPIASTSPCSARRSIWSAASRVWPRSWAVRFCAPPPSPRRSTRRSPRLATLP
jgi:SAM domain (Sterile alpha motif)